MTDASPNAFHYDLMAAALRYLEDHAEDNPSLDQVAAAIGMSPAHFQRVFSQWVGVSPKRYQQYLALDHAKTLLRDRFTVLDATYEAGMSSPGRLHDLFVRWEAMSPGAYAAKGAGLTISYGFFDTPFGEALAMGTDRGLCGLAFTAETGRDAAMADMQSRWPEAAYVPNPSAIEHWVRAAFGEGGEAQLLMIGAPFQIKVWEALLTIPTGHVTTYGEIARVIGAPKAVRAVGTAVGRNPISWLIPCHRAMRKSGGLGGYHWGLPVKRAMLAWESARVEAAE
ncbi:AraC family transcriptional regulator of adaptative response/methylated-DNA-[protein]-cysteine methyltransferase [Rubricella aquisinus]|uniref:methylated-DNA--[protein]-cysteine S-methyltransferase n=1 Tax=Rubricella aquisinus TaxID=2028108 RepID=A0A840WXP3_9RHOB|nr:bifunctional helix-turn-helix domain-containing protein/methylated-DNA--[protein]-cysteine S-methyltransferase [Rubricella aquisinus]MBB5514445.1 AraC family transcriptional regulator of adaptative response/methylated-DNA-[protein]-cysteine methyltransferase [Rubricella aquisinus]